MRSIHHEFTLHHSVDRVWAAITDPAAMAEWLMPNDFQPVLGHRFTFRREPIPQLDFDGIAHCEVVVLEPKKHLAFTFKGGPLDTQVSFTLAPTEGGTRLVFEHSGFDEADPRQVFSLNFMGKGWADLGQKLENAIRER